MVGYGYAQSMNIPYYQGVSYAPANDYPHPDYPPNNAAFEGSLSDTEVCFEGPFPLQGRSSSFCELSVRCMSKRTSQTQLFMRDGRTYWENSGWATATRRAWTSHTTRGQLEHLRPCPPIHMRTSRILIALFGDDLSILAAGRHCP
jgi:hypothetical protein